MTEKFESDLEAILTTDLSYDKVIDLIVEYKAQKGLTQDEAYAIVYRWYRVARNELEDHILFEVLDAISGEVMNPIWENTGLLPTSLTNQKRLEFKNRDFGGLSVIPTNFDFKTTALIVDNCRMEAFGAPAEVFSKTVQLKNCTIGSLSCHGTYFLSGFQMTNCIIENPSTFDCGGHNIHPNEFFIDHCIFNGYVDFFDVYFAGPVRITNNHFRQGTSMALYLTVPSGIKEGLPFSLENNTGELDKYAENDPFNPQNLIK
jgi:hypothetical protein